MTVGEDDGDQSRGRADQSHPEHFAAPVVLGFLKFYFRRWLIASESRTFGFLRASQNKDYSRSRRERQRESDPCFGEAQVERKMVQRHAPGEEGHVDRILDEARQPPKSRLQRGGEQRAELESRVGGGALAGEEEEPPDEEGERAEEEGDGYDEGAS